MLTHMGGGAGQGLEDALMLSRLLSHPETNAENLEVRMHTPRGPAFPLTSPQAVLQAYSDFRLPRAQKTCDGSLFVGRVLDGNGPHGEDWEKLSEDISPEKLLWPLWRHDFDAEFATMVAQLREQGAFSGAST